jgi:hypothetical protein
MMERATRYWGLLVFAALAFAGCHELGHIDGMGDYGGGTSYDRDVVGEVDYVDTRAREIEVRTDAGRTTRLRYDDKTQVIYRQRNYSPTNLERGDYIAARIGQDREGRNYADTITVRESVQDRGDRGGGSGSRFDRLEGRVEYIDQRRGTFDLRDSRNRLTVVSVPFNAPRQIMDRFNRLREGDNVRIEGRSVANDRFELESFL